MKIAIAGIGYVGLSNGIVLAQNHEVVGLDINKEKVTSLNAGNIPIIDQNIKQQLDFKNLDFHATLDKKEAYIDSKFVVICTPTDYNPETNYFDTSQIEAVIKDVLTINPNATMVIRSTVPVGFTKTTRASLNTNNLIFCPEFLREDRALDDSLNPSRIIIGDKTKNAVTFAELMVNAASKKEIPVLYTGSTEAEAIKLFANTYLAMRVSYFNELDTFASTHNLDTQSIVNGVCLDPRIGTHYNNPSFGYGGYCLPKDSKQLLANYTGIPQNLIRAIVESNTTRMDFIANDILERNPKTVGIHRLIMKSESDNFRSSSIVGIIDRIKSRKTHLLIYEPELEEPEYFGVPVVSNLEEFIRLSDVIVTNRMDSNLNHVKDKIYTKDLFGNN